MNRDHHPGLRRGARGITLLDALFALIILCLATTAAIQLSAAIRRSADLSRHQAQAVRIAQSVLDQLRHQAPVEEDSYEALAATASAAAATMDPSTPWETTIDLGASPLPAYRSVRIRVAWVDAAGQTQSMSLTTILSPLDPRFNVLLALRDMTSAD
jgi:Tfp pilus assembly protein PilV